VIASAMSGTHFRVGLGLAGKSIRIRGDAAPIDTGPTHRVD
jgi:hypothetical protein